MKTFGLFMLIWFVCILISYNVWKEVHTDEMIKMVLATQLAFILYKLIKEEGTNK